MSIGWCAFGVASGSRRNRIMHGIARLIAETPNETNETTRVRFTSSVAPFAAIPYPGDGYGIAVTHVESGKRNGAAEGEMSPKLEDGKQWT